MQIYQSNSLKFNTISFVVLLTMYGFEVGIWKHIRNQFDRIVPGQQCFKFTFLNTFTEVYISVCSNPSLIICFLSLLMGLLRQFPFRWYINRCYLIRVCIWQIDQKEFSKKGKKKWLCIVMLAVNFWSYLFTKMSITWMFIYLNVFTFSSTYVYVHTSLSICNIQYIHIHLTFKTVLECICFTLWMYSFIL